MKEKNNGNQPKKLKKNLSLREQIVDLEGKILNSVQMDNWSIEPKSTYVTNDKED